MSVDGYTLYVNALPGALVVSGADIFHPLTLELGLFFTAAFYCVPIIIPAPMHIIDAITAMKILILFLIIIAPPFRLIF